MNDAKLLSDLLSHELTDEERDAFSAMARDLKSGARPTLTAKQRAWAKGALERFVPTYENLVSSGKAPRGAEVPTPAVLQNLPLRPPTRAGSR